MSEIWIPKTFWKEMLQIDSHSISWSQLIPSFFLEAGRRSNWTSVHGMVLSAGSFCGPLVRCQWADCWRLVWQRVTAISSISPSNLEGKMGFSPFFWGDEHDLEVVWLGSTAPPRMTVPTNVRFIKQQKLIPTCYYRWHGGVPMMPGKALWWTWVPMALPYGIPRWLSMVQKAQGVLKVSGGKELCESPEILWHLVVILAPPPVRLLLWLGLLPLLLGSSRRLVSSAWLLQEGCHSGLGRGEVRCQRFSMGVETTNPCGFVGLIQWWQNPTLFGRKAKEVTFFFGITTQLQPWWLYILYTCTLLVFQYRWWWCPPLSPS